MKTTLKEIKRLINLGIAQDVTNAGPEIINDIIYGRTVLYYSAGLHGVNGCVVQAWDGKLYAVTQRCGNLLQLIS